MTDLISGLILISTMGCFIAVLLQYSAKRYPEQIDEVVIAINNLLPQTQCAQCDYPGCKPYAEAIANGEDINHCPPGGEELIRNLAVLLGRETKPLDLNFGETKAPSVAVIREAECIGCTFCIKACPVDAIIGAPQQMHSIITEDCTGCELCLEPCPVDCIDMLITQDNLAKTYPLHLLKPVPKPIKSTEVSPCIRCGECEIQCPKSLAPHELYFQRESKTAMEILDLDACIECRICDRACPSHIPLTRIFVETKQRIESEKEKSIAANTAESKFLAHEQRQNQDHKKIRTRASRDDRASILAQLSKNNSGENK
ncbi:MAG: electron transport complex subunit RsxB [Pseudomonadales bacterium]|nr:electron transport complex subunit RsxB [Pseudomonadales bacterium]